MDRQTKPLIESKILVDGVPTMQYLRHNKRHEKPLIHDLLSRLDTGWKQSKSTPVVDGWAGQFKSVTDGPTDVWTEEPTNTAKCKVA